MQETSETRVRSLGWEDPLEEEMATHTSIQGTWWATVHSVSKGQTWLKQISTHAQSYH